MSSTATLAPALGQHARAVAAPRPEAAAGDDRGVSLDVHVSSSVMLRCGVRVLDQQRDALAAADAGRGDAVAQARALELARQRQREPHAGGAQRMADARSRRR